VPFVLEARADDVGQHRLEGGEAELEGATGLRRRAGQGQQDGQDDAEQTGTSSPGRFYGPGAARKPDREPFLTTA